jgi:hypothetical protein
VGIAKIVQGAVFLRKTALSSVNSHYTNSDFAITGFRSRLARHRSELHAPKYWRANKEKRRPQGLRAAFRFCFS